MSSLPTSSMINMGRTIQDNFTPGNDDEFLRNINEAFAQMERDSFGTGQTLGAALPEGFVQDIKTASEQNPMFGDSGPSAVEAWESFTEGASGGMEALRTFGEDPLGRGIQFVGSLSYLADQTIGDIRNGLNNINELYPDQGETVGLPQWVTGMAAELMQPIVDLYYDPFAAEGEMERLAAVRATSYVQAPTRAFQELDRLAVWDRIEKRNPFSIQSWKSDLLSSERGEVVEAGGMAVDAQAPGNVGWNDEELTSIVKDLASHDWSWLETGNFVDSGQHFGADLTLQELPPELRAEAGDIDRVFYRGESEILRNFVNFMRSTDSDAVIERIVNGIKEFNYSQPGFDGPVEDWQRVLKKVYAEEMSKGFGEFWGDKLTRENLIKNLDQPIDREAEGEEPVLMDENYLEYFKTEILPGLRKSLEEGFSSLVRDAETYGKSLYNGIVRQGRNAAAEREVLEQREDQSDLTLIEIAETFNDIAMMPDTDTLDAKQRYRDRYIRSSQLETLVASSLEVLESLALGPKEFGPKPDDGIMEGLQRMKEIGLISDAMDVAGSIVELREVYQQMAGPGGINEVMLDNVLAFDDPAKMYQGLVTESMRRVFGDKVETYKDVVTLVNDVLINPDNYSRSQRINVLRTYGNAVDTFSGVYETQKKKDAVDGLIAERRRNRSISRSQVNMPKTQSETFWGVFDPGASWRNAPPEQTRPYVDEVYGDLYQDLNSAFQQMTRSEGNQEGIPWANLSNIMIHEGDRISFNLDAASPLEKAALSQTMYKWYLNQPTKELPGIVTQLGEDIRIGITTLNDPDILGEDQHAKRAHALTSAAVGIELFTSIGGINNPDKLKKFLGINDDEYRGFTAFIRWADSPDHPYFSNPGMAWEEIEANPQAAAAALAELRTSVGELGAGLAAVWERNELSPMTDNSVFRDGRHNLRQITLRGDLETEKREGIIAGLKAAGIRFPPEAKQADLLRHLLTVNGKLRTGLIAAGKTATEELIQDDPELGLLRLLRVVSLDGTLTNDIQTYAEAVSLTAVGHAGVSLKDIIKVSDIISNENIALRVNEETEEISFTAANVSPLLDEVAENYRGPDVTESQALGKAYLSQSDRSAFDLAKRTLLSSNPNGSAWVEGLYGPYGYSSAESWDKAFE